MIMLLIDTYFPFPFYTTKHILKYVGSSLLYFTTHLLHYKTFVLRIESIQTIFIMLEHTVGLNF